LLSERLDLPEIATRAALPGGGGAEQIAFARAARLDVAETRWFLREMQHWGWLEQDRDLDALILRLDRPM
jgi:DNA-binding IclR family transcriptional regulator